MTTTAGTTPTTFAAPSAAESGHGRLLWTDLMVPDVEAATRFYTAVTGWTMTSFATGEGTPPYMMWTAGATPVGGVMPLSAEEVAGGASARWLGYLGTPDVDATYRDALALGARAIVPPRDIPTVGRFAIIADPQGAGVALFRSANPPAPPAGAPGNGEFTWYELGSLDADASVAFYTRLFGWTLHDTMPMGPDAAYRMFGADERTFFAIYPLVGETAMHATVPPQWLPYVRVADMARSLDAVRQGGGQVLAEPREIPGGDYVARCADPFGAQFALHAAAPRAAA